LKTITKKRSKIVKITKKKVWEVFSKYIRLSYSDKDGYVICYTCGRKLRWQDADAGHGASGRGNSILFDERLVRPQCTHCNIFLKGNYDVFHAKLIKEYGKNFLDEINRLKKTVKKFTQSELNEKYEHYKKEVEKLEVKE